MPREPGAVVIAEILPDKASMRNQQLEVTLSSPVALNEIAVAPPRRHRLHDCNQRDPVRTAEPGTRVPGCARGVADVVTAGNVAESCRIAVQHRIEEADAAGQGLVQ